MADQQPPIAQTAAPGAPRAEQPAGTPLGVVDKKTIAMYLNRWHHVREALRELHVNFHNCGVMLKKADTQEDVNAILGATHREFSDALHLVNQMFFGVVSVGPPPPEQKIEVVKSDIVIAR